MNVKTGAFDTHFTYTDQERDDESGLMYYGARYYHPVLGRFTQPDPVIIDTGRKEFAIALANPQLLNPYSYVGNNPLKHTDTKGEFIDTIWDVGSVGYDFGKLALGFGKGFVGGITGNKAMMDSADALVRGATIDVGADAGATFIPFVPAGTTKAIRAADKAKDAVKAVKGGEKTIDASKAITKIQWSTVPKPSVGDKKLQSIVKELYDHGGTVGTGNTADAIRYEVRTGQQVRGSWHFIKGSNSIRSLEKWISKNLNSKEVVAAKAVLNDLKKAFEGK